MSSEPGSVTDGNPASAPLASQPASLIHRPASFFELFKLDEMFPLPQPLEVELGSGDGSFLARYAKQNPGQNFIGVERLLGRLRKLDRKGRRAGLQNLRLVRIEAAYLVEYLLPRGSVAALHIYFPDPWPKRKHRKNRLVNERFTELARQALSSGGTVFLRTDDANYFAQMVQVFAANPNFKAVETPTSLSEVVTDFERNFNLLGVPTLRAAFGRIN